MTKRLENRELIERYEKVGIEINEIFVELVSRRKNGELTDEEYGYVTNIASRRCSEIVGQCYISKEDIKEGFERVAKILPEENR